VELNKNVTFNDNEDNSKYINYSSIS